MAINPYPHPKHSLDFRIQQKPGRLLWIINRLPTWMFKLGLGRLLGKRFAMVVHRGRKTGRLNTVIVETCYGDPDEGKVVFVSAYGNKAQWYLNLARSPAVSFHMNGKNYYSPRHEFLGPVETERAVAAYFERYPGIANFLAKHGQYPWPGPVGTHDGAPIGIAFYLTDAARNERNKEVAAEFMEAFSNVELDRWASMIADDATYEIMGNSVMSGLRNKTEIVEATRGLTQFFPEGIQIKVRGMTAEGDRVAMEAWGSGKAVNGEEYNNVYHLLFVIQDGKIKEGREYLCTKLVDSLLAPKAVNEN